MVLDGIMTKVHEVFKIGKTGKLVFKKRPWLWYVATVISVDTSKMVSPRNGFVVITMRAYYPFARSDKMEIDEYDLNKYDILANSNYMTKKVKLPSSQIANDRAVINRTKQIILYNPGTQRAKVAIEIAGDAGNGITITNKTTDQSCRFVGFSHAITNGDKKYIICDGLTGKTVLTDGINGELAFLYHDYGFIELQPGNVIRNLHGKYVKDEENKNYYIELNNGLADLLVGKYVYVNKTWHEVVPGTMPNTIRFIEDAGFTEGDIVFAAVTMNKIQIKGGGHFELTKLKFDYKPTFS